LRQRRSITQRVTWRMNPVCSANGMKLRGGIERAPGESSAQRFDALDLVGAQIDLRLEVQPQFVAVDRLRSSESKDRLCLRWPSTR